MYGPFLPTNRQIVEVPISHWGIFELRYAMWEYPHGPLLRWY